jgi:hypothetical protein
MLDFKFISQHSKALRFDFELKTFDECGQQLEQKTITNYLTVDQNPSSITQSKVEERGSTFAVAHP